MGVGGGVGVGAGVTTILPGDTLLEDPPHAVRVVATPTTHRASKNCFIPDSDDMINPYGSIRKDKVRRCPAGIPTRAILGLDCDKRVTGRWRNDDIWGALRLQLAAECRLLERPIFQGIRNRWRTSRGPWCAGCTAAARWFDDGTDLKE